MTICPTRILNPTYTAHLPLPTDYTWGCPPHQICRPDKHSEDLDCDFEAGPPADSYYCSPRECFPAPPSSGHEPEIANGNRKIEISPDYFNLSPLEFGIDYGIFVSPGVEISKRLLSLKLPGKCYKTCNSAMLEAESHGKTPSLCETSSAFLTLVKACHECVDSFNKVRTSVGQIPAFQQFYFYCAQDHNESVGRPAEAHQSVPQLAVQSSHWKRPSRVLTSAHISHLLQSKTTQVPLSSRTSQAWSPSQASTAISFNLASRLSPLWTPMILLVAFPMAQIP